MAVSRKSEKLYRKTRGKAPSKRAKKPPTRAEVTSQVRKSYPKLDMAAIRKKVAARLARYPNRYAQTHERRKKQVLGK